MAVTICVMLWAAPGQEALLVDYEDQVLGRLGKYQARVLFRVRAVEGDPTEVQVLKFPSEDALEAFQRDPDRVALANVRARAIDRTQITRVDIVTAS